MITYIHTAKYLIQRLSHNLTLVSDISCYKDNAAYVVAVKVSWTNIPWGHPLYAQLSSPLHTPLYHSFSGLMSSLDDYEIQSLTASSPVHDNLVINKFWWVISFIAWPLCYYITMIYFCLEPYCRIIILSDIAIYGNISSYL